jgi:hypothetical protein
MAAEVLLQRERRGDGEQDDEDLHAGAASVGRIAHGLGVDRAPLIDRELANPAR